VPERAQEIVDRYLAATGGREAALAERTSYTRGRLSAFGLQGTVEAWSQHPDRSASHTVIGPFTVREGNDGTTAWRVDQNGKFAKLDGKDLENARAGAWFDNQGWLLDRGGSIVRLPDEGDSTGRFAVLEVTPPVGRNRILYFSLATGLLERTVTKMDERTVTQTLSDYRRVAGRQRAHAVTISIAGMPANDVRLTIDSIAVNVPIDPAVFAPAVQAVQDVRFLGAVPLRLPFAYSTRHVWLRASVNGRPEEDFLLDTGASITVIDSTYAARIGLESEGAIQAAGAAAAGHAAFSALDSLRLGQGAAGVVLTGQKVAVMPLNRYLEPFFWTPIAGILGYDFLSRFVTEVSFDRKTIALHDPATFRYTGTGTGIPMTMAGNIPVVKARIDDRYEGDFRLDVGSGSTVDLHTPFVEKHGLREKVGKTIEVTGGGFGGTFTTQICRMQKFEIGPYAWEQPLVSLARAQTGGLSSEDYAGNVGNQILDRFTCTFDYERRMVYLEPGERFGKRDRFSLAGVQLARFGDRIQAMQVIRGSAADEAGIRFEDEVVALDGKPASSYTVEQVNQMFDEGRPGTKHVVEVLRDGKRKKLTMKLRELL
jgi:predicted aspartyl protease